MIKKLNLIFAIILCSAASLFSQTGLTMPTPRILNQAVMNGEATVFPVGQYSFTEWASTEAAGTYPANMMFYTIQTLSNSVDPLMFSEATGDYTSAYNLTSGVRMNGRGVNGVSFLNTSSNPKVGIAMLALNTFGRTNINVAWQGRTFETNVKIMGIALQYKLPTDTEWTLVNTYTQGSLEPNTATVLPERVNNQALVLLRWIYYHVSGTGTRSSLGIDDILITSSAGDVSELTAPTLLIPANLATEVAINPTLTWNAVANATSYRVQAYTSDSIATPLVDEVTTNTSKQLAALSNSAQYLWRVKAMNATDSSAWSNPWAFTTMAIPAIPAPIAFNITGGGIGEGPFAIGLDSTEIGVAYKIMRNNVVLDSITVLGTGSAISFGSFTEVGTYTAKGMRDTLITMMNGNAVITAGGATTYTLSGTIKYSNNAQTTMNNCIVIVKSDNSEIARDTTDATGNYSISGLADGSYSIEVLTNKTHGGINGLDVSLLRQKIGNTATFTPLQMLAGDINNNGSINGLDVAPLRLKIANGPSSNWSVVNYTFYPKTVTISGADSTLNIQSLCGGDVNGSHTPNPNN